MSDMDEDFGGNFVTLTDEDGNEYELEHLDTIEYNGAVYMAFMPVIETEDGETSANEEDLGMVLLRVVNVDGEDMLEPIEDSELEETVYNEFIASLFEEDEE